MTNRYSRHQTIINREKDAHIDDDYWFNQFEKNLQKSAVTSKRVDDSLFNQINSLMGRKSKHTSVSAAVEEMMQRSGLTNYLKNVKLSEEEKSNKKIANSLTINEPQHVDIMVQKQKSPLLLQEKPNIISTIKNVISTTRGNLPLPAILEKIRSIHKNDVSDDKFWEDEDLIKLISSLNLQEKSSHHQNDDHSNTMGKIEMDGGYDYEEANQDAFHSLMPAKI